jgi:hypothetical protein
VSDDLIGDWLEINRVPPTDAPITRFKPLALRCRFFPVAIGVGSATIKPERSSQ